MNLREWLTATNPHKPRLSAEEKQRRRAVRARVIAAAGTSYGTIISALHRNRIGTNLLARLEAASAGEAERILAADQFKEVEPQAA